MEIILMESVDNLGKIGDVVKVRAGYARNYLIPHGRAKYATPENVAELEQRRAELEAAEKEAQERAQARFERINNLRVTIAANAGPEGKLFGSIGTTEIADAMSDVGFEIEKKEVRLPEGPMKAVGEYDIQVHLHADTDAKITIVVVPEEDGEDAS